MGYSPWGHKRIGHGLVTKQQRGTQYKEISTKKKVTASQERSESQKKVTLGRKIKDVLVLYLGGCS